MQTECSPTLFEFEPVERHKVVAGFDGGIITSDAGGLLLGRLDRGLGLIRRMARCFTDRRDPRLLEHTVETLVGQRVFALALGYEDLNDHDELRHDLSLLLIPSGTEILVFWVLQRLAWLVAPKDVPLMTRRGDLKLSHGATAKAERTP